MPRFDIVTRMLAGRSDVVEALVKNRMYLIVMGRDQVIRVFATALYRVTGARPVDPNWEERGRDVQQYELRVKRLDVRFDEKLKELYEKATTAGKWKGTAAVHDRAAYWTEAVLAYDEGPLLDRPDVRPWSLHRTGYAGSQRYGGWIWSGDIDGKWETLAARSA